MQKTSETHKCPMALVREREFKDARNHSSRVGFFKYMPTTVLGHGGHLSPSFLFRTNELLCGLSSGGSFVRFPPTNEITSWDGHSSVLCCTSLFFLLLRERREKKDQRQLISLLDIYLVNIKEHQAKHQRDPWEIKVSLSPFFRWWESKRSNSQHLFFCFCLGNHRRTHSSSVRTYSSACVCVYFALSLLYSAHWWLPEELERRAVWVSSYIVFFFEMLLFLIVKRKVQPTIIIRYWAKKEYKKHWWEMCFVSLSSTEAEAFRQKKRKEN